MSWNKELGIWKFGIFRGTTPRNARVWTFDVVVGKWELWIGTGPHSYITFFSGPEEVWSVEIDRTNCDCYGCRLQRPMTVEEAAHINQALRNIKPLSLPPRGCHPADCCGDLSAHCTPHECSKGCVC